MLAVLRDVQKDEHDRHLHQPLASCRSAVADEWVGIRVFLNEENGLQPGQLELASLPAMTVCGRTCWEREMDGEGDGAVKEKRAIARGNKRWNTIVDALLTAAGGATRFETV